MADYIGRESAENPGGLDCEQWEALLADKLDAADAAEAAAADPSAEPAPLLAPAVEAAFAEHSRGCAGCGSQLEQARQGRQWLRLLNTNVPPPPTYLLSRILASTQGAGHEMDHPLGTAVPLPQAGLGWMLPGMAHRRLPDARLLMTAAMAFFSVALTLSLVGVRITSVHAAELRPQAMQANVTRSFYGTKKQVVSFYENLRLVYEVESKMQDLRRDVETPAQAPSAPAPKPDPATTQPGAAPAKAGSKPSGHGAAAIHGAASGQGAAAGEPVRGWPEAVDYQQPGTRSAAASGLLRAAVLTQPRRAGEALDTEFAALPHTRTGAISKERNRI